MAMPPDGSSPWCKSEDLWVLADAGAPFASLSVAVGGSRASITMPYADSAYDHFFVVRLEHEAGRVAIAIGDEGTAKHWTDQSVPLAKPRPFFRRERLWEMPTSGELLATLEAADARTLHLVDRFGRLRIAVHRGTGASPRAGTRLHACRGALEIDILEHRGTTLSHHETSMP